MKPGSRTRLSLTRAYILRVWSVGKMSERWSLVRVIFRSKNILFHGPKVTGKKVLLHGHIAEGKSGLGYWLLSQTGRVEQPPLFLDVVAARNDTNIDPSFGLLQRTNIPQFQRLNIPQNNGTGILAEL